MLISLILSWLGIILTPLVIILLFIGVIYTRWNYGTLESTEGLGVVIKPYFIGGSDPFFYKGVVCEDDMKRGKRYGPMFGMYEGRQPRIFVTDPKIIRQVFVEDFESHFNSKRSVDGGHKLIDEMMDVLPYGKWRVVRAHFTPQLTTSKIKAMSYQMLATIEEFIDKFKQSKGEMMIKFDPKQLFTFITVDVIARCAFGTKINAFDNPNCNFIKNVNALALEDQEASCLFIFLEMFPHLFKLVPMVIPRSVMTYFETLLKEILSSRRAAGKKSSDQVEDFVDVVNSMIEKCSTDPTYKALGITEVTAMAQAAIFLVAGFESTSVTSALLAYHLARNSRAQTKLIQEIDAFYARNGGVIKHENLAELTFLNACISETLRMHPPVIRLERECQKDWRCDRIGLKVKAGTTVMASAFAIHYDEDNYPDPYEWRPERFLPENRGNLKPYTFLSFGIGPHNCIGLRFAKEEMQMVFATLLRTWQFEDRDQVEPKLKPARLFINNFEPFELYLVPRRRLE